MGGIYANSLCTIAAARSKDPKWSLFTERDPTLVGGCMILHSTKCCLITQSNTAKADSTIEERAWCMQEEMMSRRVIYFGERVRFGCNTGPLDESLFDGIDSNEVASNDTVTPLGFTRRLGFRDLRRLPLSTIEPPARPSNAEIHEAWSRLVFFYTSRKLTKEEDGLVALSAIARHIKERFDLEYVAGLWLKTFPRGLLWQAERSVGTEEPTARRKPYEVPTWSWASCKSVIVSDDWDVTPSDSCLYETLDAHVKPKAHDPLGTSIPSDAWLEVVGFLLPIEFFKLDEHRRKWSKVSFELNPGYDDDTAEGDFLPDYWPIFPPSNKSDKKPVYSTYRNSKIRVESFRFWPCVYTYKYWPRLVGLMLKSNNDHYERVGHAQIRYFDLDLLKNMPKMKFEIR